MQHGSNRQAGSGRYIGVAGNLSQQGCVPCMRPNSAPARQLAGLPWLILVAAGAAGLGIFLGTQSDDTNGRRCYRYQSNSLTDNQYLAFAYRLRVMFITRGPHNFV